LGEIVEEAIPQCKMMRGGMVKADFGWMPDGVWLECCFHCDIDEMTMSERRTKPLKPSQTFSLDRLDTPIGTALLVTDDEGVLRALDWEDYAPRMRELLRLHHGVVVLKDARAPAAMRTTLTAYFNGDLDRLTEVAWRVAGTPFQQKVWVALAKIPAGQTMSYGALAAKLNMPNAMRAVGHANGANPISVVVPCHRLIGADGSLVKYGGGLDRKRWLLRHEGVVV
jgi:methylated-DNA-[protein]-cysteine S-methyltransferase